MKLEEFMSKYNITISEKMLKVCQAGLAQMQHSQDHVHNDAHVEDIISLLDVFLQSSCEVSVAKINFEILLPAICWHDIWKSYRPQTTNLLKFKFEQYWDGIGSAIAFSKYARQTNIPKPLAKKIRFAILHHGSLFANLSKSHRHKNKDHIEARLVDDLDSLDSWSLKRLKYAESKYLDGDGKFNNPKLIPIVNWAINKFTEEVTSFSFEWSRQEFARRRESMLKRTQEVMAINKR
jgi:hypothetical protein